MFDRNVFARTAWLAKLAGRITPNAYLIARAMLRRSCRSGSLWPSKATLAADVGVSERTVARALVSLAAEPVELVRWRQRDGLHHKRTSNLYQLTPPAVATPFFRLPRRKQVKGMNLESFPASLSVGSAAGAVGRLAAAIGAAPGELDWLLPAPGRACP